MDEDKDKKLQKLVDSALGGLPLDEPSVDFTMKIMQRIEELQSKTVYQPLIPKRVLYMGLVLFIFGIGCLIFIVDFEKKLFNGIGQYEIFNQIAVMDVLFSDLNIPFSNTIVYTCLALTIMVVLQTSLLKHYFDKRLI